MHERELHLSVANLAQRPARAGAAGRWLSKCLALVAMLSANCGVVDRCHPGGLLKMAAPLPEGLPGEVIRQLKRFDFSPRLFGPVISAGRRQSAATRKRVP
jgi:hypothetical protein